MTEDVFEFETQERGDTAVVRLSGTDVQFAFADVQPDPAD